MRGPMPVISRYWALLAVPLQHPLPSLSLLEPLHCLATQMSEVEDLRSRFQSQAKLLHGLLPSHLPQPMTRPQSSSGVQLDQA